MGKPPPLALCVLKEGFSVAQSRLKPMLFLLQLLCAGMTVVDYKTLLKKL